MYTVAIWVNVFKSAKISVSSHHPADLSRGLHLIREGRIAIEATVFPRPMSQSSNLLTPKDPGCGLCTFCSRAPRMAVTLDFLEGNIL